MKIQGKRTWNNPVYSKAYSLWKSMKARCYNANSKAYVHYGAKGVTMSDRWLIFDNFLEDLDKIEGFNYTEWIDGKLHLDKDIKQQGESNKIYSLETCMFVSPKRNTEERATTIEFWVVNSVGKLSKEKNLESYTREHNINTRSAHNMLFDKNSNLKHVKGYQFFKEKPTESQILKRKLFKAIKPDGTEFEYTANKQITDVYNIPSYTIQKSIREGNKTKHGWKFELIQDGYYLLD